MCRFLPQTISPSRIPNFNFIPLALAKPDIHFLIRDYENFNGYRSMGILESDELISPIKGKPLGE